MWAVALRYSTVGLEFGIAVVVGYGIGWWLDKRFDTAPILTLVMLLFGIGAGFMSLVRVAMEASRGLKGDEPEDGSDDTEDDS